MSRNKEYVNPAGLRLDGRRPLESRHTTIQFGTVSGSDGSCIVEMGSSKVYATVFGPRECASRQEARHDEALLTCDVAIAAFAGENRHNPQRKSKQCEDIAATVVQAARSVVQLSQYPNSQIHIYVEVLQQDGSDKVASINAACLALIDASVAMRDVVCCVNAGLIDNHVLVDLTNEEMRSQCAVISVAFTGHDTSNIIWMETSSRLSQESLALLMEKAQACAAAKFRDSLRVHLQDHANTILRLQNL